MAKMSEKTRNQLITIMKEERSEKRCEIVKGLMEERDEVANDYDVQIAIDAEHIKKLDNQITEHGRHKRVLNEKRTELLTEAKLSNFDINYGSCGNDGRPQILIDFDIETRNLKKEILER
jgi:hypothetical protein